MAISIVNFAKFVIRSIIRCFLYILSYYIMIISSRIVSFIILISRY